MQRVGTMTHQFTPANLAAFIKIRAALVPCRHRTEAPACPRCQLTYRTALRKRAGVTATAMDFAVRGHIRNADTRTRIWRELGCDPAESGVRLTDDGGQEALP